MKHYLLKMWYLGWISQYNNKYSRQALFKLLVKVKKNIKQEVYSKIKITDTVNLYFDSIFELLIVFDVFINSYKDYSKFNPRAYIPTFTRSTNLLDFLTLDKTTYVSPVSTMERLINKVERLLEEIDQEKNKSIYESKLRNAEPLLKDALVVLEEYFIKLIDGEEIKEKF